MRTCFLDCHRVALLKTRLEEWGLYCINVFFLIFYFNHLFHIFFIRPKADKMRCEFENWRSDGKREESGEEKRRGRLWVAMSKTLSLQATSRWFYSLKVFDQFFSLFLSLSIFSPLSFFLRSFLYHYRWKFFY